MSLFVQQQEIADPFVLEVIDRPEPHAGPGEVRVRVRAAGLNPVDWKIATHPAAAHAFGVTMPAGFGNDLAGEIDEVGDGVTGWAVGDRVYGGARGRAVAEHVVLDPATLERTPDGLSDEVAGTLQIAGRTADAAVHTVRVAAGDTVLIGGAAGGVGV
ncbi:MAG TPA: alcohol dehydrogenase catalytic domain-containing protein, partial [Microbacterium sp.]|uniref:quinone oxidoreductase family protein n=1 Tax=Microbacterium sp. TaxID=51671 RepID=UPI002B487CA4